MVNSWKDCSSLMLKNAWKHAPELSSSVVATGKQLHANWKTKAFLSFMQHKKKRAPLKLTQSHRLGKKKKRISKSKHDSLSYMTWKQKCWSRNEQESDVQVRRCISAYSANLKLLTELCNIKSTEKWANPIILGQKRQWTKTQSEQRAEMSQQRLGAVTWQRQKCKHQLCVGFFTSLWHFKYSQWKIKKIIPEVDLDQTL